MGILATRYKGDDKMATSANIQDYVVTIPDDPSVKELQDLLIKLANKYPTAMYNYKIQSKIYSQQEDIMEIKKQKIFRDIAENYTDKNLTITEKKMMAIERLEEEYEKLNHIRGKMLTWEAIVKSVEEQINICKKILQFAETEYKNSSNI